MTVTEAFRAWLLSTLAPATPCLHYHGSPQVTILTRFPRGAGIVSCQRCRDVLFALAGPPASQSCDRCHRDTGGALVEITDAIRSTIVPVGLCKYCLFDLGITPPEGTTE